MMKQIRIDNFGQPSQVAKIVDVPDCGTPAAWEVVVAIEAFPINAADLAMMAGRYGNLPNLPATIGMEAIGWVKSKGAAVGNVEVGDRVVLLSNNNWAEERKVPAATVHKVPVELDPIQLSMMKVNPSTAMLLLSEFVTLQSGDWIIQSAPLSSVGRCVIQLANARGIKTLNIVRRAESQSEVLAVGGTAVVVNDDITSTTVSKIVGHHSIQLALDAVAGDSVNTLASCLGLNGTIVNYGMLSGQPCVLDPELTIFRNVSLRGFWLSKLLNRFDQAKRNELYKTVCDHFEQQILSIKVDSIHSFADIHQALRRAEQNDRSGKVLVRTSNVRPI